MEEPILARGGKHGHVLGEGGVDGKGVVCGKNGSLRLHLKKIQYQNFNKSPINQEMNLGLRR